MAVQAGRYRVSGKSEGGNGYSAATSGTISLLHGGDVSGMLTDGPIASGSWDARSCSFLLVYNGSVPFTYSAKWRRLKEGAPPQQLRLKGSWGLQHDRGGLPGNSGTVKLTLDWQAAIEPPAGLEPALALPLPGSDGNRACEVRPVSALEVPCSMCSEPGASLSFFDMVVPHFGAAELLSFSCAECGYKYNKVRTAIGRPLGPCGRTLTLHASTGADLRREVVTSDAATVRLEALDLEVQATGRYTTVEGLVNSLASGLSQAAIVMDGDGGGGEGGATGMASVEERIHMLLETVEAAAADSEAGGGGGFTLTISDPLAMSFIAQPPAADDGSPPRHGGLEQDDWQRSAEQNMELGLIDGVTAGELWEQRDDEAAAAAVAASQEPPEPEDAAGCTSSHSSGGGGSVDLLEACEALAAEFTREYDAAGGGGGAQGEDEEEGGGGRSASCGGATGIRPAFENETNTGVEEEEEEQEEGGGMSDVD